MNATIAVHLPRNIMDADVLKMKQASECPFLRGAYIIIASFFFFPLKKAFLGFDKDLEMFFR